MSLALDVFIAKKQLRYGNDCPNTFPDDYEPPPMEPVQVDWTWLERYSLEKLDGDELLAIWEQLGSHNGCRGIKDIIRRRLNSIGKKVRLGRRRKEKTKPPPDVPNPPNRVEVKYARPYVPTIIPKRDVVRACSPRGAVKQPSSDTTLPAVAISA